MPFTPAERSTAPRQGASSVAGSDVLPTPPQTPPPGALARPPRPPSGGVSVGQRPVAQIPGELRANLSHGNSPSNTPSTGRSPRLLSSQGSDAGGGLFGEPLANRGPVATSPLTLAPRGSGTNDGSVSRGIGSGRSGGGRGGSSHATSSQDSAAASAASASVASSSASTRAPSPAPAPIAQAAGHGMQVSQRAPSQQVTTSAADMDTGQLRAPVRWNWKPQDVEHQQRERGVGAGHLRGRRSNLARIREIQGLG